MKDILLTKHKAKNNILFTSDAEDDWFVQIIYMAKKSGKQMDRILIIQKDLEVWLNKYKSEGWIITN